MHMMGALLYEIAGLPGNAMGDENVAYGCYHGFFGKAKEKEGPSTVAKMDASCPPYF